jgi:hypothetical protein
MLIEMELVGVHRQASEPGIVSRSYGPTKGMAKPIAYPKVFEYRPDQLGRRSSSTGSLTFGDSLRVLEALHSLPESAA